jgi:cardiolipin synthase
MSNKVLTVPNVLSFIRLLLVPVFLWFVVTGEDFLALIVLVFSSLSDYVDGQIARRFHQITRLGQLLDPAADRLFIFATLIGLAVRDVIPWWFAAIIVARDLMLLVLGIVLANAGYGPLPVHHLGKLGTFLLYYALPIIVLGLAFPAISGVTEPVGWAFAIWGAFIYWWAGIIYVGETRRLVRISKDGTSQSVTLGS